MIADCLSATPRIAWSLDRALLLGLLLALPIDWFEPTGTLLREGGAKPSILIIATIVMVQLFRARFRVNFHGLLTLTSSVPAFGLFAFLVNAIYGWSVPINEKYPISQFGFQSLLLIFALVAPFVLAGFLRTVNGSVLLINYISLAALTHFLVFVFEYCIPEMASELLFHFRGPGGLIDRPSGLMSEPSYFGTLAALFGFPLLLLKSRCHPIGGILGVCLIFCGAAIQAKTIVPVLLGQAAIMIIYSRNRHLLFAVILAFLVSVSCVLLFTDVLDTSINMSSATRFGSVELGLDLCSRGYAITGIGTGQFHFFYTHQFAPDKLLVSPDFAVYLSDAATSRGSTYNFPIRLILETGIVGALCYLIMIGRILNTKKYKINQDTIANSNTSLGLLLIGGSFGFLMTQDTYCYPPLILGLALVLASRPQSDATRATGQS